MLFLTGRSQLPGELQCGHGICMMVGQMDTLSLLSLKEMKAHLWQFHQGEKKKEKKKRKEKKGRQRGFREDSPLSDFQPSKKKASSMFSSSDTFVPPLHACRHVPCNAQKAPTAPWTALCPHALPASRSDYLMLSLQTNQSSFYIESGSCEARWDRPGSLESERTPAVLHQTHSCLACLLLHL